MQDKKREKTTNVFSRFRISLKQLIVLSHRLEVCLRMQTCRAFHRSFLWFDYETAVTALPEDFFIFFEHFALLYIIEEFAITFLMFSFNLSDHAVSNGDFRESFLLSDVAESRIKFCPLFILTSCCSSEVLFRCSDNAGRIRRCDFNCTALKKFEETLCMFFFLFSCLSENGWDLFKTLFLSNTCEEFVTTSCLLFTGKWLQQIFLCFCSFNTFSHVIWY